MSPKLLNILLVLTPLVLYFGFLNPLYTGEPGLIWSPSSSIFALKTQNVQYVDALKQVTLIKQEMDKITKEYKAVDEAAKKKIGVLLPDTIDEVKLRNEVLSISNKAGVAISSFSVRSDTRTKNPALDSYLVSFSVRSHYSVFKTLMEGYEKSMRLYVVDSVGITRPEKKNDQTSIVVDDGETLNSIVTFRVYSLK